MYRRVHTRGKWRDVRRPTRWRSSNGLEAAQTIHSSHSVESTVHQCFDFIVDCCYYRCPLYNDNLRLLSNHIQLPLAWHRDNSWESAWIRKLSDIISCVFLYLWFFGGVLLLFRPYQIMGLKGKLFLVAFLLFSLDALYRVALQLLRISLSKLFC